MARNFAAIFGFLAAMGILLERRPPPPQVPEKKTFRYSATLSSRASTSTSFSPPSQHALGPRWLPPSSLNPAKRATELWFLQYGVFWIVCFGIIIGGGLYEWFDRVHYMGVCVGLALPLLLQPLLAPELTSDEGTPFGERYSTKANAWIAIFSFIGNYWYTHYFYSVLRAQYTMRSWDINGVPIPMFFATHFYFTFYHTLSNCALRRLESTYVPGVARTLFTAALVAAMSYTTAFMETLTIAGFPCYKFENWHEACTIGSAFYGIYFLVSFPMFRRIDELGTPADLLAPVAKMTTRNGNGNGNGSGNGHSSYSEHSRTTEWVAPAHLRASSSADKAAAAAASAAREAQICLSLWQSVMEALASGMIVLCLLDFVRVWLGEDMHLRLDRPCKSDAGLTCAPFTETC